VRLALERRREQHGDAPPVVVVLPAHVRERDAPVWPSSRPALFAAGARSGGQEGPKGIA
jgi:hypothetical protein